MMRSTFEIAVPLPIVDTLNVPRCIGPPAQAHRGIRRRVQLRTTYLKTPMVLRRDLPRLYANLAVLRQIVCLLKLDMHPVMASKMSYLQSRAAVPIHHIFVNLHIITDLVMVLQSPVTSQFHATCTVLLQVISFRLAGIFLYSLAPPFPEARIYPIHTEQ